MARNHMSHLWADNHRCDLKTSSATEAQHVLDPKAKCLTCPSVNLVSTTNNNNDKKKPIRHLCAIL